MWNCGCGWGRAGDHQRTISPKWGQLPSQVVQIQYNPNPNTIQPKYNTIQHKWKYSALDHNKHTRSKPQHKYKTHYYTIINNFDMYTLKFVLITGQVICVNQKIFTNAHTSTHCVVLNCKERKATSPLLEFIHLGLLIVSLGLIHLNRHRLV